MPAAAPSPSSRIGRYRLLRQAGRGGLGVVWRAVDERTGRVVALKLLNRPLDADDAAGVAGRRLSREFKALSALDHRHVVRVFDAGVYENVPYLVMEFVDGLPMRAWLAAGNAPTAAPVPAPAPAADDDPTLSLEPPRPPGASADTSMPDWLHGDDEPDSLPPVTRRPVPAREATPDPRAVSGELNHPVRNRRLRELLVQLADGLAFIHGHGLVHRDLKPSNVLVADGGCAKLVDFGLVKVLGGSSGNTTAAGHVVGTWRYMAPEQAKGADVDGRADLYALGSLLYEQLTGEPPFVHKQPAALLNALVSESPAPVLARNPGADPDLAAIAMRLLAKDPAARFQRAEDVAEALGVQPGVSSIAS